MRRIMDYAMPGLMAENHEELRAKFEPLIEANTSRPEVHIMSALTLRLARLSLANRLINEAGFKEESVILLRGSLESIINLLYIMHVGPILEAPKTSAELAKQFMAYADLAFYKFINVRGVQARATLAKAHGLDESGVNAFVAELTRKRDYAKSLGCVPRCWHSLGFTRMAEKVRANLPDYVFRDLADIIFSCFVPANSAVHGDALSLRSQYKELENAPLEIKLIVDPSSADVVGSITLWAWQVIAKFFDETDWLNLFVETKFKEEFARRNS